MSFRYGCLRECTSANAQYYAATKGQRHLISSGKDRARDATRLRNNNRRKSRLSLYGGELTTGSANTLPNSASPWLIYSPAETTVVPGNLHAIRVTVSVPKDATPGDHLTSLIVEQRADNIKLNQNLRQMVIRYRMAAVFYIKVPQLRRQGSLEGLRAEANAEQVVITPLLKNSGNSVIRPLTSLKVTDNTGVAVAELPQKESLPLLGGAELMQPFVLESRLAPGTYTVKYRVDFQDGSRPTEGVTEFVIPASPRTSAGSGTRALVPVSNE